MFQKKKQILAQQPFLVRTFPFGISRQICFFYEVGLSDQCPQPLLHEEKNLDLSGIRTRDLWVSSRQCYQLNHWGRPPFECLLILILIQNLFIRLCNSTMAFQILTHTKFLCSKLLLCWNRACVGKFCVAPTQICVFSTQVFVWWPVFPYKGCLFATQKFQNMLNFNTRAISDTRVLRV
jgi:hypothetical protein